MILQIVPGAMELMVLLIILFLLGGVIGRWVYRDAKARGSEWAWQWAVGIVILFVVGFVPGIVGILIYLGARGERTDAAA